MQLLCILMLPVILMVSRPRKGLALVALMGVAGILYTAYIIVSYDAAPAILMLPQQMMKVSLQLSHSHYSITRLIAFTRVSGVECSRSLRIRESLSKRVSVHGWPDSDLSDFCNCVPIEV